MNDGVGGTLCNHREKEHKIICYFVKVFYLFLKDFA